MKSDLGCIVALFNDKHVLMELWRVLLVVDRATVCIECQGLHSDSFEVYERSLS